MFGRRKSPSDSKDNLGMQVLWPMCGEKEDNIVMDIVFVHGLRGSRHGTWTKDGVLWPQELLSKDYPRARVLTWGYDADVFHFFGPVGEGNINDHSNKLLLDLSWVRFEDHERERPLIFIAHSLGGLIVKDALSHSDYQGIQKDGDKNLAAIKRSTKGVLFAGTPHRGADKAKWVSIAGKLAKFIQKDQSGELLDSLERGDQVLERLQKPFSYILRDFALYTLYEELPYPKIGKIVENDSAILGDRDEKPYLMHGDHSSMIKFSNREDEGYKSICRIIRVILKDWIVRESSVSPPVSSASPPHLRSSSPRTSRRGNPLLIEGTPESSSESQNRHVSPLPSEHGRDNESASGPGLVEPFHNVATNIQVDIDEDRILELLRQADQLFFRPNEQPSTKDILTSQSKYTEALDTLKKQPSRHHSGFHTYIYDKLAQINVTLTYNKAYPKEEQKILLSNAAYHAHKAMRWAQSSHDSAAIAKTRLLVSFVQARRVELDSVLGTSGNKTIIQNSSTQIIDDIARGLNELSRIGSTSMEVFNNEAQRWTEHLRRISELP